MGLPLTGLLRQKARGVESWRSRVSAQAQEDLDGLLDEGLRAAQHLLGQRGEFYPFAVVASAEDGSRRLVAAEAESEPPDSAAVLGGVYDALRSDRDQFRAAAVVSDVRLSGQGTNAVQVAVEHREGTALSAWLPYRKRLFRRMEFGAVQAALGTQQIW